MKSLRRALLAAGVILLAACGSTSSSTTATAASSAAATVAGDVDPAVAALENADISALKFSYADPSKSTHAMTDWQTASDTDAAIGTDILSAAKDVFGKITLNPQEEEPSEENLVYSIQAAPGTTVYLYSSREVKCVAPGSRNLYTVEDVEDSYAKLLDQIDAAIQAQASSAE